MLPHLYIVFLNIAPVGYLGFFNSSCFILHTSVTVGIVFCLYRNSLLTLAAHLVGMLVSGFITFAALGINGHTDTNYINSENMTGMY